MTILTLSACGYGKKQAYLFPNAHGLARDWGIILSWSSRALFTANRSTPTIFFWTLLWRQVSSGFSCLFHFFSWAFLPLGKSGGRGGVFFYLRFFFLLFFFSPMPFFYQPFSFSI